MHRYGKTLLPQMQTAVHSLVAAVLPADDLPLVNHIHAFYVQYGQHVGQTSLATHADDSHWTINLCISLSPDLRGSELVFDPQNVVYTHSKAGRGIIHRGCMRHHVEPLLSTHTLDARWGLPLCRAFTTLGVPPAAAGGEHQAP